MKRRMHINSLRNLVQYREKFVIRPDIVEQELIESLAREGERIIRLAYASRGFKDRTYNLRDSYVSAVFKNGVWLKSTTRYVGEPKSNIALEYGEMASGDPEMGNGRDEADKFLAKLQFSGGRPSGIALIVGAAMFYSGIVESRGYSVLANIQTDLETLARKGVQGVKYLAHIDLDYASPPSIYREDGVGKMEIINR